MFATSGGQIFMTFAQKSPSPPSEHPWERLDPALALALEPELPGLADEIIAEIGRAIPDYRRPLEGAFGRGLRIGVRQGLEQFLDLMGHSASRTLADHSVYLELGRGELRSGRRLDALQAAYRLGARLAWRRMSDVARRTGADVDTVSLLAESIFAYIDELSASSVEGYAQAQAALAGEQEHRRRQLVRLLVGEQRPEEHVLRAAARDAGWRLPATVAVLASDADEVQRLCSGSAAPAPEAIGALVEDVACVLVPDPEAPGCRERLARALGRAATVASPDEGSACVALGPAVPCDEAPLSFARAREGLRLQRLGLLPRDGLLVTSEHFLALLLLRDEALAGELSQRGLRPFDGLSARTRARLQETLLAWLRHQGSVSAVAGELHVHRQTVRYRLTHLRELFGDDLEDPERRLEIELALRAARLSERGTG